MDVQRLVTTFLVGGVTTSAIVMLEGSGHRTISGLAALVPVFTVVSYLFIGDDQGGQAVGQHSKFVLIGTLVSWVPYMLAVALLAPRVGARKAIGIGLGVFLVLATAFIALTERFKWFR